MPSGFQPCPASGPCNVLPLGDSITEDVTQPGGAWRIEFFSRAIADDKDITFVGSRSNGPDMVDGQPFPKSHEGTSGITIGDLHTKTNMVGLGDAHIILLHIGTNDMYQDVAGAPAALRSYVEDLIEQAPDALLVVCSIIPFNNVEAYNATIEPLVDEKAAEGAHILFADQYTAFPANGISNDGVHPNPSGYAVMGGVYYDLVKDYLP
jgi:hypothetical protein